MPGAFKTHTILTFLIASFMVMGGAVCFDAYAQDGKPTVQMKTQGAYRYVESQGVPHHAVKNPKAYAIKPQSYKFKVPAKPQKVSQAILWQSGQLFGVALDGVPFNQRSAAGWNNDLFWLRYLSSLELDQYGGVLNSNSAYLYGGAPKNLVRKDLSHVGYAADGFPVFVSKGNKFKSSYRLKKGERPAEPKGPGGKYDGTYFADYEYVPRAGHLDECNGLTVKDQYYIYIITDEFPRIPLCWNGQPDKSFFNAMSAGKGMGAESGALKDQDRRAYRRQRAQ